MSTYEYSSLEDIFGPRGNLSPDFISLLDSLHCPYTPVARETVVLNVSSQVILEGIFISVDDEAQLILYLEGLNNPPTILDLYNPNSITKMKALLYGKF